MLRSKITISLPPAILKAATLRAKKERRSISEVFSTAFQQYEERATALDRIFAYGEKKAKEQGISDEDIVRMIRELREEEDRHLDVS